MINKYVVDLYELRKKMKILQKADSHLAGKVISFMRKRRKKAHCVPKVNIVVKLIWQTRDIVDKKKAKKLLGRKYKKIIKEITYPMLNFEYK